MAQHIKFTTPCGFEIHLITVPGSELVIRSLFNGEIKPFVNGQQNLSAAGARMLRDKLTEIYGKG